MQQTRTLWVRFLCIYHLSNVHSYLLYANLDHSLQFLAAVHPSSFGCGTGGTLVCFNEDPKRYPNPQGIEEEQVDPLYMKLDVTRLGELLSHSGTNVIHPALGRYEVNAEARKRKRQKRLLTAVQLSCSQQNHPEPLTVINAFPP